MTLAIEVDGFPVCVDIINTTRPFKRQTAPGRILGDLASVHGKLFAAFKSAEERARLLAQPSPRAHARTRSPTRRSSPPSSTSSRATTSPTTIEGFYAGLCAVGAPVRDQLGEVVAAISVVMPTGRFGPEVRRRCAEAVKHTADPDLHVPRLARTAGCRRALHDGERMTRLT